MPKKTQNEWTMDVPEAMKLSGLSRNFIINAVEQGFIKGTVVVLPSGRRKCRIVRKAFMRYLEADE